MGISIYYNRYFIDSVIYVKTTKLWSLFSSKCSKTSRLTLPGPVRQLTVPHSRIKRVEPPRAGRKETRDRYR